MMYGPVLCHLFPQAIMELDLSLRLNWNGTCNVALFLDGTEKHNLWLPKAANTEDVGLCAGGTQERLGGGGIVPTVTVLFLHLIFYCLRPAKTCLLCRLLALYLLHVRSFSVSAEQSVLSTPKWEKKIKRKRPTLTTAWRQKKATDKSPAPFKRGWRGGKKIPTRLSHDKEMSIPVPDEQ